MSRGYTFTVNALMGASVGQVFNTTAGRVKALTGDLRRLRAVESAAAKVTTTQARVADLKVQAAAGKDVSAALDSATRAYNSAARAAAKYGVDTANAAKAQAQATAQINRTQAALGRQQALMASRAKRSELQGEIMGTVAVAATVGAPIKLAVDFESAMADAAKTIDGMRDDAGKLTKEYYDMEAAVKAMGRELPLTHQELAALFAAGGQMGLSTADELREFSTLSAHMAVAFGMGTEAAADAIGGYKTKLALNNEQTREMLDLMNQFANTSSATEKDIAGIVSRVGALGGVAGIAYRPMTAMAATLASMKIPEEVSATGLKNFMLALTKGEAATKKQQLAFKSLGIDHRKLAKQMQTDSQGAMIHVLERISKLPKHAQAATLTRLFGSESVGAIAPLLTRLDLLKENLIISADTTQFAGAMQKEFENRAKTTANALVIAKNKAAELGITIGAALLPAVNDVLTVAGNGAVALTAFASAHPEVATAVMGTVAALAAYKVASLAGGYAFTVVRDAWTLSKGAWAVGTALCRRSTYAMIGQRTAAIACATGTRVMAVAQWALNAAMTANPIGIAVAAVAALAGGLVYLYNTCEPVRAVIDGLWDGAIAKLQTVGKYLSPVVGAFKSVKNWVFDDEEEPAEPVGPANTAVQTAVKAPALAAAHAPTAATAESARAIMAQAPPSSSGPPASSLPKLPELPKNSSGGNVTIAPNITFSVSLSGIPSGEMADRVMDSLRSRSSELERIVAGLIENARRTAYAS